MSQTVVPSSFETLISDTGFDTQFRSGSADLSHRVKKDGGYKGVNAPTVSGHSCSTVFPIGSEARRSGNSDVRVVESF